MGGKKRGWSTKAVSSSTKSNTAARRTRSRCARSADLLDDFRELRERSYHDTTIGAVIDTIAAAHKLKSGASPTLRGRKIEHIDQTNESDANFLRRLGKQFDAVATVKNDTLLFSPAGDSKTARGKPLPSIPIKRSDGDHHRFHSAERDTYTGVRVFWYDQKHNARFSVVAGRSGNAKRLRTIYASKDDAIQAARAEWQRVQRGIYTLQLDLAIARPQIMPQSPVRAAGWKPIIDATEWMTVRVSTRVDANSGMSQSIELETVAEESDDSPIEPLDDPDKGITGVTAIWQDKISKKKGEELAGKAGNIKKLPRIYATKYSARKGAKLEWAKLTERRELIAESSQ
ncbi:MAG: contractile injection system protein, VgrG/Pvc8 family [Herbaspirillum sp.]